MEENLNGSRWFHVGAHFGLAKSIDRSIYIYAGDAANVYSRYEEIPGIKKKITPFVEKMSDEDSLNIEEEIISKGLSIDRIKQTWYDPSKNKTD